MEHQFPPLQNQLSDLEVRLTFEIATAVRSAGGQVLIVGGYVRDLMMGAIPKDLDLEVYGLEVQELQQHLQSVHPYSLVGASFGVFKVGPLDVTIPRTDNKSGIGHRGFSVQPNPHLSHKQAAKRRDFTINAMALDPLTGQLFDEYGGRADIDKHLLRAVDLETFAEDPLRALRAMQFAGRFGFQVETKTAKLISEMDLGELSNQRIGEEWNKLLLKSEEPSVGLSTGNALGIIPKLHPELQALITTSQDPLWHPEGSVWNHTLLAVDAAATIVRRETLNSVNALTLLYATLCHDFGKPDTTNIIDGRLQSPGHAKAGVIPTRRFLKQLCVPQSITIKVEKLVANHMFLVGASSANDAEIRRLAKRLAPATIQQLVWLNEADYCARMIERPDMSVIKLLEKRAKQLRVSELPILPLIHGQDLIELGVKPGKKMGELLNTLEEAQLDGVFETKEDGITYVKVNFLQ